MTMSPSPPLQQDNHNTSSPSAAVPSSQPSSCFIISLRIPSKDPQRKPGVPSCGGGIIADADDDGACNNASYITQLRSTSSEDGCEDATTNPYTYNLNDNVGVEKWSDLLKEHISASGDLGSSSQSSGSVLVLITGFNNHAPKVMTRYRAVQHGLAQAAAQPSVSSSSTDNGHGRQTTTSKTTVICFDWPASKAVRYFKDRDRARKSAKLFFGSCLRVLKDKVGLPSQRIHILTFSMGAFLLYKAFASNAAKSPQVGHVIMAQSDTARRNFTSSQRLSNFTSWIGIDLTVYWSSQDTPLRWSSLLRMRYRLGLQGIPKNTLLMLQQQQQSWARNNADNGGENSDGDALENHGAASVIVPIHNVSCTKYYKSVYSTVQSSPNAAVDSHEWVFFGKGGTGNDVGLHFFGDEVFMADVRQVLNGATIFSHRERKDDTKNNIAASGISTNSRLRNP